MRISDLSSDVCSSDLEAVLGRRLAGDLRPALRRWRCVRSDRRPLKPSEAIMTALVKRRPPRSVIPGFGLSLGFSILYLSLIVLIPLTGVFFRSSNLGWHGLLEVIFSPRVLAALRLSFGSALIGPLIHPVLVGRAWCGE